MITHPAPEPVPQSAARHPSHSRPRGYLPGRPHRPRRPRRPPGWAAECAHRGGKGAAAPASGPARLLTPRPELGCWRRSAAPGLRAGLARRLGAGPLPARALQQRPSAPRQPGGGGSSSRTAPLHTSEGSSRCCLGKRFSPPPRCQKQISYISSVHADRAEVKCLLFLVDSKRS